MGVDRLSVRAQMSKTRRGTSGSRALFRDGRFPQTGVKLERSYYPAVICICVKHDPRRRGRKTAKSRPTSAEEVSGYIRKRIRKTVCACVRAHVYVDPGAFRDQRANEEGLGFLQDLFWMQAAAFQRACSY